jgi:hypothetical protein
MTGSKPVITVDLDDALPGHSGGTCAATNFRSAGESTCLLTAPRFWVSALASDTRHECAPEPSIWGTGRQFCRRMLSAQIDLYGGSGVLAVLDERNAGRQVVDVDAWGYVTIPARTGVVELGQALVLRLSHGAGDH